jgi:Ankyrin repeats (3 copies)
MNPHPTVGKCIALHPISADANFYEHQPRKVERITSSLPDRMLKTTQPNACPDPDTVIQSKLLSDPVTAMCTVQLVSYDDPLLQDFFIPPTQVEIDAYDHDILNAVRTQDIPALQLLAAQGRPMKCSNRFGESILHLACRKGLVQVAAYLLQQAQIPLEVCDDYGRSPLHDACWSHKPNFELIDLLLSQCPDLLYIKDKRGFTPLKHVRRELWGQWNAYLQLKPASFLMPKRIPQSQCMHQPIS